jgi:hypothetical protein
LTLALEKEGDGGASAAAFVSTWVAAAAAVAVAPSITAVDFLPLSSLETGSEIARSGAHWQHCCCCCSLWMASQKSKRKVVSRELSAPRPHSLAVACLCAALVAVALGAAENSHYSCALIGLLSSLMQM